MRYWVTHLSSCSFRGDFKYKRTKWTLKTPYFFNVSFFEYFFNNSLINKYLKN